MADQSLTKNEKALISIDFLADEKILTQKEKAAIKLYLSGQAILIDKCDEFLIDDSECPMK